MNGDAGGGALLGVCGLRFLYRERQALAVDELDLREGETTVLVGENGSGKTTLLKLLNGLLAPSAGEILYRGRPLMADGGAAIRRDSVLVHQTPYLFRGSVYHNVVYGLKARRPGGRRSRRADFRGRVREALGQVGLAGFEGRSAAELSGGERQRVALARAVVLRPKILFLDEPTANVDADTVRQIEALLLRLAGEGTSLVLSSHHDAFAYRVARRLVRLEEGRIRPSRENILKGQTVGVEEGFSFFRTGGALLRGPAREGEFRTAVLRLEDVILSRRPIRTSAQNRFQGRVLGLEREDRLVRVRLDCGFPLQTLITEASVRELEVEVGKRYYTTFKASAVRLY